MEEHRECSVIVYFAATAPDDFHELYHKSSPPSEDSVTANQQSSLRQVYRNVRTLLDEDVGGFEEVFVCSQASKCFERLDVCANAAPTVALVEFSSDKENSHDWLHDEKGSLHFLRGLSTNVQGARFQKHVLAFALLANEGSANRETLLDGTTTRTCLQAGAIDILLSPLHPDDVNRVIGHIKDMIRPPARLIAAHMAQNLVDSIHNTTEPGVACHRPDLILSAQQRIAVENAIAGWHFPASSYNMDELTYAAVHMIEQVLRTPELEAYGLERAQLISFILATRRQYKHENEVHYHNWRHAVDVTQSIYCFLQGLHLCPLPETDSRKQKSLNAVERLLSPLDGLILLVSAIGHDVGHPGVNNAFLVACNHPLAQTYNDKSVLENYHCAAYSQLIRRHWPSLHKIESFRATMISTILATDMQRHFEYMRNMSELKAKTQSSEASVDRWSEKDRDQARELIMALLIKAADISNVARPFDISARWAKILMNEFARQGELESELDIPTCLFGGPPDKENILAAAQSQKGFMSLFGYPLFSGISEIMPSFDCVVKELENNRSIWDKKIEEETAKQKPNESSHLSLDSVSPQEVERATGMHRSEPRIVPLEEGQPPSTPIKRGATSRCVETSPSRHAAHELRQQLASGIGHGEDKRSSMPFLASPSAPTSPSRRSSKDVALDQLQQLTAYHQTLSPTPGSRRESSDTGIQVQHSYPSSRRGSKDESLTTILVTSGSTPNRRDSPSSPTKATVPSKTSSKRQNTQQKPSQARASAPCLQSHPTSTATATTQNSPQTQPSSTVVDDESEPNTRPVTHSASVPSTEDPFKAPGTWPDDDGGGHRVASPDGKPPSTPPTPPPLSIPGLRNDSTSKILTQVSSNGTEESRATPRKESGLRETRSRSRLRSLKFWKRKKSSDAEVLSSSGSP